MICSTCRAEAERIRADREGVDTPPPSTRTEPDEEARRHPLHRVIAEALAVPVPGAERSVRVWGRRTTDPQAGPVGNAWAGTPEDVADHLVRVVLDNLSTLEGGRLAVTQTLEHVGEAIPVLTTDERVALLLRLRKRAGEEIQTAEIPTADGSRLEITTSSEVLGWLDGLISRARGGADL